MTNERTGSGGGASRPRRTGENELVRHEEQATVAKRWEGSGYATVRRDVDTEHVGKDFPLVRDELVEERVPADANDSGQIETLPDGSISVPLFEEELVVTRRTVLRERVIIRKEQVTEWERVEADVKRERIAFDVDDVPEGSVRD